MPKIEPAVQTLTFVLDDEDDSTNAQYIDLSQCASLVNRRFYRQGLNWAVAGFSWHTASTGAMLISKIPDTWVAANAWTKGLAMWNRMNNEALRETDSVKPKFYDFKVYMDSQHHRKGDAADANLMPTNMTPAGVYVEYTPGEWEYSSFTIPRAFDLEQADGTPTMDEFKVYWTGASYGGAASGFDAVSLIEGYAASRALPAVVDPNAPADAADTVGDTPENWMAAIFNEGTTQSHEIIEDLIAENNIAPYPYEGAEGSGLTDTQYPGGANQAPGVQIHDIAAATTTTVGGTTRLKGGNFMGGLIKLNYTNGANSTFQVHLVPGNHRGYLAQSMKDL